MKDDSSSVDISKLVNKKGALSSKQIELVRKWTKSEFQTSLVSSVGMTIINRLLATVDSLANGDEVLGNYTVVIDYGGHGDKTEDRYRTKEAAIKAIISCAQDYLNEAEADEDWYIKLSSAIKEKNHEACSKILYDTCHVDVYII